MLTYEVIRKLAQAGQNINVFSIIGSGHRVGLHAMLIIFGGVTDRLIPLFAIGAFLAFTLSQAGMVAHWIRVGGKNKYRSMIINGVGAVATGITLVVVFSAKFTEGAWITALLVPLMLVFQ